ncbi:MAG TPA: ComF family protein [Ktedonobacteraceae bacterium]|nr:ComF family protein [Ktedonobacteraceae bacterium]
MGGYDEPLRTCIHALKYYGQTRLAEPLGALLARTCRDRGLAGDVIVPVPLHPERQRQRGYNQSQLLAEACARALGIPLGAGLLTRVRATQAQAQLAASERQSNVAGAFACISPIGAHLLARRNVLLIDDVSTSGATLEACAASLFATGAQAVWGVVLARPVQQNDQS